MTDQCQKMKLRVVIFILVTFALVVQVNSQNHCLCVYTNSTDTLLLKCDTQAHSQEIAKCFEKYKGAKTLVFTDSGLMVIPHEIRNLKQLTYLDLSRNKIDTFDLAPLGAICKNIQYLILNENNITKLEKGSMDCLTSLVKFHVVNNSISSIENGTFSDKLTALEATYIMYNSLTTLDASMVILPKFRQGKNIIVNATWNDINLITNSIHVTILDINRTKKFYLVLTHNNFTGINFKYYRELFEVYNILDLYRLWNCGYDLRFNPLLCDCSMEIMAEMLAKFRPVMDPDNPVFSITCYKPASLAGMMIYKVPLNQFNCTVTRDCPRGCSCTKTEKFDLITVNCGKDYKSSTLPERIPEMNSTHVNIKSNRVKELSNRDYLINTTLLDVSGCAVNVISTDILLPISRIQTVHLHDNALVQMPKEIEHIEFTGLQSLTLRGNPFACDCHSLWLKKWLLTKKVCISDIDRVLCGSGPGKGNQIIKVADSDFICEHSLTTSQVLIIVFSVVFFMVVIFVLVHHNRASLQMLMIAYFNVNCFRRKAEGDFPFDVFISHSSKDDEWVIGTLLKYLENQVPPYKVFFDERDFLPGKTIIYNVIRAITISRTTLLVLTNNFLRSDWCKMEFKQAHLKLLKDRNINFIVIIMEELDETLIGQELKFYLKTNVYIKYTDKYFWAKLLHALPMTPSRDNNTQGSDERRPLLAN